MQHWMCEFGETVSGAVSHVVMYEIQDGSAPVKILITLYDVEVEMEARVSSDSLPLVREGQVSKVTLSSGPQERFVVSLPHLCYRAQWVCPLWCIASAHTKYF